LNRGLHTSDTIQTTTAASIFDTDHESSQHEASTQRVPGDKSTETPGKEIVDHFEIVGAVEQGDSIYTSRIVS